MTEPKQVEEDVTTWRIGRDGRSVIMGTQANPKPLVHGTDAATKFDIILMANAKQLYAMLDDASVELKLAGAKTNHIDKLLESLRERVPQ